MAKRARKGRRTRGSVVQFFPATTFVLAAYVGLILPIAIINSNPELTYILRLLGTAVLGCLIAELAALTIRMRQPTTMLSIHMSPVGLRKLTKWVVGLAVAERVVLTRSGGGTLAAQIAGTHSTVTTILSPFAAWNLFGIGLLFACYLRGDCGRRFLIIGLLVLTATEWWAAIETTRTAPLQQFVTTILLVALVLRLVRVRTLIIALVVVLIGWPTVFAFRNASRTALGATVDTKVGAWDRLRLDTQLGNVAQFENQIPVNLGQPGVVDVLRFGLIPRVIDRNRTEVASSSLLSRFVGSTGTSSYNFLSIGTIYFFYGSPGLLVYYLLAALLFTFLVGRSVRAGPVALCMMVLAASDLMSPAQTFPDAGIAFLQGVVSFLPILLIFALSRERAKERAPRTRYQLAPIRPRRKISDMTPAEAEALLPENQVS